jgi:hypothetical protein
MYGNPEVTSGGNALKFYASVRLEVRRKLTLEGAKGEHIGIRVKAKARRPACACRGAPCAARRPRPCWGRAPVAVAGSVQGGVPACRGSIPRASWRL